MNYTNIKTNLSQSSVLINEKGITYGQVIVNISNISKDQPVDCDHVVIGFPYGTGTADLTDDKTLSFSKTDGWTAGQAVLNNNSLSTNWTNEFGSIDPNEEDSFHFFKIAIFQNPAGTTERTVSVSVDFFAGRRDATPFLSRKLKLTLKSQIVNKPVPFVNYFAASSYQISEEETTTLSWNISNGKKMVIQPVYLSKLNHYFNQHKLKGLDSGATQPDVTETDTQIMLKQVQADAVIDIEAIDGDSDDTWIITGEPPKMRSLSSAVGSVQVKMFNSTAFIIYADYEGRQGISEIQIFLKKTTIIDFRATNLPQNKTMLYGQPLNLSWTIMFSNLRSPENEAFLLIDEYDNQGKVIPARAGAPVKTPSGIDASRVVKLTAINEQGTHTVYPLRPTKYSIYIKGSDGVTQSIGLPKYEITTPDFPIGSISIMNSNQTSPLWLSCKGQNIKRSIFPHTFDQLAVALGINNYTDNLNLPNFADRFPVGANPVAQADEQLLQMGGPDPHNHPISPSEVTITTANDGSHTHPFPSGWSSSTASNNPFYGLTFKSGEGPPRGWTALDGAHSHATGTIHTTNASTENYTGLNRPKYLSTNFMIRVDVPQITFTTRWMLLFPKALGCMYGDWLSNDQLKKNYPSINLKDKNWVDIAASVFLYYDDHWGFPTWQYDAKGRMGTMRVPQSNLPGMVVDIQDETLISSYRKAYHLAASYPVDLNDFDTWSTAIFAHYQDNKHTDGKMYIGLPTFHKNVQQKSRQAVLFPLDKGITNKLIFDCLNIQSLKAHYPFSNYNTRWLFQDKFWIGTGLAVWAQGYEKDYLGGVPTWQSGPSNKLNLSYKDAQYLYNLKDSPFKEILDQYWT